MSYTALYRKYRPQNFENVVGQDIVVDVLKKSIINKKISHAYLFTGPRGTGKTSIAKIFAHAVNCENFKSDIIKKLIFSICLSISKINLCLVFSSILGLSFKLSNIIDIEVIGVFN